jgi:hypothetical protein
MTEVKSRKLYRRPKFLLAMLAVTASVVGGAQAVAPTSASAAISNSCQRYLTRGDFWGWVECEMNAGAPRPL